MKLPKTRNRLCPTCKKHTLHKVMIAKKRTRGTARPLSRGSKFRIHKRSEDVGNGNHGRYSKPPKPKMTGKKQSKKTDLRYECSVCKKQSVQRKGKRAKKVEFKQ
ncbi:MAG TPA: 50S ribosomal protein L44e [Candidatus Nanoarchaeia archaeon]|nr:50S ribosomal protein L44e [Candidatus Nanoarchaeia archaeon]